MDWRDEGILLWVRRHGESNAIIEALTAEHGRHAGLVRGGVSKQMQAILQPGAQLSLEWHARLPEHLGNYKVDLIEPRAAAILSNREALAALNVLSALLVTFLPEREPNAELYQSSITLMDALGKNDPRWPEKYAQWEIVLLSALGFGLSLESCAATGSRDNLCYISPRSARAVSKSAGGPFADRMLPLPGFLLGRGHASIGDVREALRTTGYFLEHRVCPSCDVDEVPAARLRLLRLLEMIDMPPPKAEIVYNDDEKAWLQEWDSEEGLKIPSG